MKVNAEENESNLKDSLKLVAKSSVIVFLGVVLSKIISYIYKIIIARNFGPEQYGLFTLALTIASLFVSFFGLGLPEGLLRFIPLYSGRKKTAKIKPIILVSFLVLFLSSLLSALILFYSSEFISINLFHNFNLARYLKFFSLTIPLATLAGLFLAIIKGNKKIGTYSFIVNVVQNSSRLILILIFIFLGLKADSIIYSYLLGMVIFAFAAYFSSRKFMLGIWKFRNYKKSYDKKIIKELFSYSWPIMFLGAISTIYYVIDSFVLGYFLDMSYVGYYSAAFSIVALLGVAPELFMHTFLPLIVQNYSKGKNEDIKEISKQVSKWIFILNIPILLILVIYPGAIINLFFGPKYLTAMNVVRVLALVNFFSSSIVPISNGLLHMVGKSKVLLYNLLITIIVNFLLNVALIPKYETLGAAIGTSISWIILNISLLIEVRYYVSFSPFRRKTLRIFLVSLIPAFLFIIARKYISINLVNFLAIFAVLCVIYIVLLFISGCFDKNDLVIIQSFKNKMTFKK